MKNITKNFMVVLLLMFGVSFTNCDKKPELISSSTPSISSPQPAATDNLKKVEMDDFWFYIPEGLTRLKVQGIDTLVSRFEGPKFSLETEYGTLVDPLPRRIQFSEYSEGEAETVDGRKVKIYSYKSLKDDVKVVEFKTVIGYFENPKNDGNNLLIEVDCLIGVECERDAVTIIHSVRFDS